MSIIETIASQLHIAYLDRDHSNIASMFRIVAAMDEDSIRKGFAIRKYDMLSAYGFVPSPQVEQKPFAFSAGTAVIPIHGILLNRVNWSYAGATGYDFIRSQYRAALADPDVKQIVFDVNSNGGLVAGCAELAQELYETRGAKPSLAVVDSNSYSAAYFLASAADRVVCTPTGGVGSIGVVAMHVDLSGALENEGVKVTFLHKGEEKVDGNMFEPLSDRAREGIERDIGYHYDTFVEAVARHRDLSEDIVRATEARCYLPSEALTVGLIDGIQSPTEAVVGFIGQEDDVMELTEEQVRAIAREAVEADRARFSGIRGHAEAQGREQLAEHLALHTSMSVEEAVSILAASPKAGLEPATQYPPPNGFAAVMDQLPHPNITPDGEPGGEQSAANRILSNYVGLTGRKVRPLAQ